MEEYDKKIIEFFKNTLKVQNKRPADLTNENNSDSSLKPAKIFKLFSDNPSRLAFNDFIQICQLLDLSPVEVLNNILPDPNLYKLTIDDVQKLEDALEYAKQLLANRNKET